MTSGVIDVVFVDTLRWPRPQVRSSPVQRQGKHCVQTCLIQTQKLTGRNMCRRFGLGAAERNVQAESKVKGTVTRLVGDVPRSQMAQRDLNGVTSERTHSESSKAGGNGVGEKGSVFEKPRCGPDRNRVPIPRYMRRPSALSTGTCNKGRRVGPSGQHGHDGRKQRDLRNVERSERRSGKSSVVVCSHQRSRRQQQGG